MTKSPFDQVETAARRSAGDASTDDDPEDTMTKLTTYYDFADQVCYAFEGDREEDSRAIGQGTTPEDARADFWHQVNGEAAELSHDEESGWWYLRQGYHAIGFGTREAAIAYADNHEWQAKSL